MTLRSFFLNFSRLGSFAMHWFVFRGIETIKPSTYFALSKLAIAGASASNFTSIFVPGTYSSKSLLVCAAISSARSPLFSSSLVTILKYFVGAARFSLFPLLNCLILIQTHCLTMVLETFPYSRFLFSVLLLGLALCLS